MVRQRRDPRKPLYFRPMPDGSTYTYMGIDHRRWEKVDEADVPDDASIANMCMHEYAKGQDAHDIHWREWNKALDVGQYVRLLWDPDLLLPDITTKAESKEKYDEKNKETAKKEAGRRRRTTIINFAQDLDPEHWTWNRRERRAISGKSALGIGTVVVKRLRKAGYKVERAYIILHDKDKVEVYDLDADRYDLEDKVEHVHFLAQIGGRGVTLEQLGEVIGIAPQYLIYPKGRGEIAFDNPLAYLTHHKDEDKHRYRPEEVITLVGDDYLSVYRRRKKTWDKGRAKKAKKRTTHDLDWALDRIRSGEIRTREQIRLDSEMEQIYSRHPKSCDEALAYVKGVQMLDNAARFAAGEYSMACVFVTGGPGLGKSCFIEGFGRYLLDVYPNWTRADAANGHGMETWQGEDIFFIDDGTASTLGNATLWKHILDPYHAQPIDGRYHVKGGGAKGKPRVLLISSEYDPDAFFAKMACMAGMNLGQFIRRIGMAFTVLDYDDYRWYNWRISTPQKCSPYTMEALRLEYVKTGGGRSRDGEPTMRQQEMRYVFENVTYRLSAEDYLVGDEDPALTPWYAAEEAARFVDSHQNVGRITDRPDADDVFRSVWDYVVDAYKSTPVVVPDDYKALPPAIPVSKALPTPIEVEAEVVDDEEQMERERQQAEFERKERERVEAETKARMNAERNARIAEARSRYEAMPVAERNAAIVGVLRGVSEEIVREAVRRSPVFAVAEAEYSDALRHYEAAQSRIAMHAKSQILLSPGAEHELTMLGMMPKPLEPDPFDYIDAIDWLHDMPRRMVDAACDPETFNSKNNLYYGYGSFVVGDKSFRNINALLEWCYAPDDAASEGFVGLSSADLVISGFLVGLDEPNHSDLYT